MKRMKIRKMKKEREAKRFITASKRNIRKNRSRRYENDKSKMFATIGGLNISLIV
jgi:hypothetical protein